MGREQSIDTLNQLLRGELAAVETYLHALPRFGGHEREAELRACMASHERRVELLRGRIQSLGGAPVEAPGAWGTLALVDEALAAGPLAGDEAAISLLEDGEDHGLKLYLDEMCKLDQESRRQIEREILPEQIRTHDSLSDLRLGFAAP